MDDRPVKQIKYEYNNGSGTAGRRIKIRLPLAAVKCKHRVGRSQPNGAGAFTVYADKLDMHMHSLKVGL